MNRRHFLRTAILFLGLGGSPFRASGAWKESATIPSLEGFGLEGALPRIAGKVVYLDFWASWCAPCKASFPVLDKWQRQFAAKGFTVLGISVDENPADMQRFLKAHPVSFPVARDVKHKLATAADIAGMPTSFLIDRKGAIRRVHNGFHPQDETILASQIASLLASG